MIPWLDDGDVRLYHGDALETVRAMPDESVDCVVTSPPYWGLRDYRTGEWDGGDPNCDHVNPSTNRTQNLDKLGERYSGGGHKASSEGAVVLTYRDLCGKCGARRVDRQMGLEPTPDLFVQGMVELFREIRRVLAPHGTCWVNLGDSYAGSGGFAPDAPVNQRRAEGDPEAWGKFNPASQEAMSSCTGTGRAAVRAGLKPKDLVGIPWRVAFALQADGWYLRSDIIWAKPNPMPESVTDRPTTSHEYVFLLTKRPRYWFDTEAVREPSTSPEQEAHNQRYAKVYEAHTENVENGAKQPGNVGSVGIHSRPGPGGRNVRSVWQIATQPYPEAHFATYPEELARRCILAGCPVRVCRVCGKPSERIVRDGGRVASAAFALHVCSGDAAAWVDAVHRPVRREVGWSDCGHNNWRPGVVLDPFIGSGTTAKVARDHQRHAIGIDLNQEYLGLAARRLQQLSLLT